MSIVDRHQLRKRTSVLRQKRTIVLVSVGSKSDHRLDGIAKCVNLPCPENGRTCRTLDNIASDHWHPGGQRLSNAHCIAIT
jgi:hypothetical protein